MLVAPNAVKLNRLLKIKEPGVSDNMSFGRFSSTTRNQQRTSFIISLQKKPRHHASPSRYKSNHQARPPAEREHQKISEYAVDGQEFTNTDAQHSPFESLMNQTTFSLTQRFNNSLVNEKFKKAP